MSRKQCAQLSRRIICSARYPHVIIFSGIDPHDEGAQNRPGCARNPRNACSIPTAAPGAAMRPEPRALHIGACRVQTLGARAARGDRAGGRRVARGDSGLCRRTARAGLPPESTVTMFRSTMLLDGVLQAASRNGSSTKPRRRRSSETTHPHTSMMLAVTTFRRYT